MGGEREQSNQFARVGGSNHSNRIICAERKEEGVGERYRQRKGNILRSNQMGREGRRRGGSLFVAAEAAMRVFDILQFQWSRYAS
jgi:hypothetical protein